MKTKTEGKVSLSLPPVPYLSLSPSLPLSLSRILVPFERRAWSQQQRSQQLRRRYLASESHSDGARERLLLYVENTFLRPDTLHTGGIPISNKCTYTVRPVNAICIASLLNRGPDTHRPPYSRTISFSTAFSSSRGGAFVGASCMYERGGGLTQEEEEESLFDIHKTRCQPYNRRRDRDVASPQSSLSSLSLSLSLSLSSLSPLSFSSQHAHTHTCFAVMVVAFVVVVAFDGRTDTQRPKSRGIGTFG